jgi:hypothetical protein
MAGKHHGMEVKIIHLLGGKKKYNIPIVFIILKYIFSNIGIEFRRQNQTICLWVKTMWEMRNVYKILVRKL